MHINVEEIEKANKVLQKNWCRSATESMQLITIHLPKPWVAWIQQMVKEGRYPNRSEAIRYMIRYYFDVFQIDYTQLK